jgi:hypothetical protein
MRGIAVGLLTVTLALSAAACDGGSDADIEELREQVAELEAATGQRIPLATPDTLTAAERDACEAYARGVDAVFDQFAATWSSLQEADSAIIIAGADPDDLPGGAGEKMAAEIQLKELVADVRRHARDLSALQPPIGLVDTHDRYVAAMAAYVEAFEAIYEGSVDRSASRLDQGSASIDRGRSELTRVPPPDELSLVCQ